MKAWHVHLARGAGMAVVVGAVLLLGGCYERVVGVRGMGGSGVETESPYQSSYGMDNWLLGEQKRPTEQSGKSRNGGATQNE